MAGGSAVHRRDPHRGGGVLCSAATSSSSPRCPRPRRCTRSAPGSTRTSTRSCGRSTGARCPWSRPWMARPSDSASTMRSRATCASSVPRGGCSRVGRSRVSCMARGVRPSCSRHVGSALWKLMTDQERLDGPKSAAARPRRGCRMVKRSMPRVTRLEKLAPSCPRVVLEAYVTLYRSERWPHRRVLRAVCGLPVTIHRVGHLPSTRSARSLKNEHARGRRARRSGRGLDRARRRRPGRAAVTGPARRAARARRRSR